MLDIYEKLTKIKNVFEINDITAIKPDSSYIQNYYLLNRFAYSMFQSFKGFIHMGISKNGKFKIDDLLEPVRFVNTYVSNLLPRARILELAAGRGANSLYLAKKNPNKSFIALDFSEGQLKYANKNATRAKNLNVLKEDYHNLINIEDSSIDLCFIIEALCYTKKKNVVLREVSRILKKDGLFIVIDGYLNVEEENLDNEILLANRLVEIGMAIPKFETYTSLLDSAKEEFKLEYEKDISKEVLPSMLRLEKWAKVFFKSSIIAKGLKRILPPVFVYNSLSGYLMPNLIKDEIANYMITVLKKRD